MNDHGEGMDDLQKRRTINALVDEAARTIEDLIDEQVQKMLDGGHPIRNLEAFRADWHRRITEQADPDFYIRARLRLDGIKLTYCREVRGTHGITHLYDPLGTDPPPPWWDKSEAKRLRYGT